jgi:transposase
MSGEGLDAWLNRPRLEHVADQVVFEDYCAIVRAAEDRVKRLEVALLHCAETSRHGELLAALQSIRGVAFLNAVTIVAEVGDFRRFATPVSSWPT